MSNVRNYEFIWFFKCSKWPKLWSFLGHFTWPSLFAFILQFSRSMSRPSDSGQGNVSQVFFCSCSWNGCIESFRAVDSYWCHVDISLYTIKKASEIPASNPTALKGISGGLTSPACFVPNGLAVHNKRDGLFRSLRSGPEFSTRVTQHHHTGDFRSSVAVKYNVRQYFSSDFIIVKMPVCVSDNHVLLLLCSKGALLLFYTISPFRLWSSLTRHVAQFLFLLLK